MNLAEARTAMVDNQIRPADVIDYRVLEAFLSTKRELFIPQDKQFQAYGEYEIALSEDRAMMTPRSLAKLIELARPKATDEVLLIGAGLGYEAAILSQLTSSVIAVEAHASLVSKAEKTLAQEGYDNAIVLKSALEKGAEKNGPYDLIFFNGSIGALPDKLASQLKPNGRMVAIVASDNVYTAKKILDNKGKLFATEHFQAHAPRLPGFAKKTEFALS